MDQFDIIGQQHIERLMIESAQERRYKEANKIIKNFRKQIKKELERERKEYYNITDRIMLDQKYHLGRKRDLLTDSIYGIIQDVKDTMIETDNIFKSPPSLEINKFFVKRCKMIEDHLFITRKLSMTDYECVICLQTINKNCLISCKQCIAKFDEACYNKWFYEMNNDNCPMCKCYFF